MAVVKEPGRLNESRLQIDRSDLFFANFVPDIQIFGGELVKNYPRRGQFSLRRLLPPTLLGAARRCAK